MEWVSPSDFIAHYSSNDKTQLIDVRESYEFNVNHITGALNIPMGSILNCIELINELCPVYVICQSGKRAAAVSNLLHVEHGFKKVYIVEGGMDALSEFSNVSSILSN